MPSTFEKKESMCIMNKQNRLPSLYLIFSVVPCSKQQHTHTNAAPCFSDAVFQVISTLPEASIVMCFPNACLQQWWDRLLIREYVLWFPCAIFIFKYIVWMFLFKQTSTRGKFPCRFDKTQNKIMKKYFITPDGDQIKLSNPW